MDLIIKREQWNEGGNIMKSKIYIGRLLLSAMAILTMSSAVWAGTLVQISHGASLESPWHKASLAFADHINDKLGGKYKVLLRK